MKKTLAEKIAEALEVIQAVEFEKTELGKHVVNDDFFYLVQEYESKDPAVARHEAHKAYVDIQYVVEGKEAIDIAPAMFMEVVEEYDANRDVVFFKEPKQATRFVLTDGGYAILYPEDSHKPGVRVDEPVQVKKIVGKVRI
jgi:YhcH/YjgK/YiaL family protein